MNCPLVTVIVATYRRSIELERAICSLQSQTYKNIEIIIVDDNDDDEWNDKVYRIVKNYSDRNNIRFVQNHPNRGSASSRNIGIGMAKGMYITFLDDDDEYMPDKILEQVNEMIEKKADYCITDLALYDDSGNIVEIRQRSFLNNIKSDLLIYHLKYHLTGTDTFMFRNEYLQRIGGFGDIDIGDEFYLMLKAIENQGNFLYINKCSVKAYVHNFDGGLSSGSKKIDGENMLYNFKKKYFSKMDKNDVNYIKMRHYAVLTYAYIRQRNYLYSVKYGIRSVLSSPIGLYNLLKGRR